MFVTYRDGPLRKSCLKMREDVETRTIGVSVQAAEVSEDEQLLCAEDDNETEELIWERKKLS